jgi:hypothetical protein
MRSSGLIELDAVLAVARHRGFRAAATELDMSLSALSHAIAALEAKLGVRPCPKRLIGGLRSKRRRSTTVHRKAD